MQWLPLTSTHPLDEWIALSNTSPVLLFKHSYSCGISSMALKRFEKEFNSQNHVQCFILDVIAERQYSRMIANTLDVIHESPQVILLVKGEVVYHASHFDISSKEIESELTVLSK